jgi:hypothetical protein
MLDAILSTNAEISNKSLHDQIGREMHVPVPEDWDLKFMYPALFEEVMAEFEQATTWKIYLRWCTNDMMMEAQRECENFHPPWRLRVDKREVGRTQENERESNTRKRGIQIEGMNVGRGKAHPRKESQ